MEHSTRSTPARDLGVAVALFLLALGLAYPVFMRGLVPLDEGSIVHVAERLANGEVLYRDVATGVMPGAYYGLAILFRLFEPSLSVGRVAQMVLFGASVGLVYLITRQFASRGVALVTGLLQLAVSLFAYRYPNYSPPAIVLLLIGTLAFLHHLDGGRRCALIASGIALSLSFLCKQNYGLAVYLALLGILVLAAVSERRRRRWVDALLFVACFLVPLAVVLAALLASGAFAAFFNYAVLALFDQTLSSFFKPYPILDWREPFYFLGDFYNYLPFPPLVEVVAMREGPLPKGPLGAAVVAVYLAVPAVLAAGLLVALRDWWQERRAASAPDGAEGGQALATAALVLAAWALFAGVYPRSDFHHLALVLPLPLVVAGLLFERCRNRHPAFRLLLSAAAAALFVASLIPPYLPVFFALPERLDTPLPVDRAAAVRVGAEEADRVGRVVEAIHARVPRSQPLLVVPDEPLYYFLAERPNPSPFPLVLPGSFDEAALLEMLPRVDTVLYTDVAYDETAVAVLFPRLGARLANDFRPDPDFLASGWQPSRRPVYLLERRPPERPRPAVEVGAAGIRLLAPEPDAHQEQMAIVTAEGRLVSPQREEVERANARPWFLKPSIRMRPPSGWQKLVLAYPLPSFAGRLELRVVLRPPAPHTRPDGAVLEVYRYEPASGRPARLASLYVHPDDPDSWRGRPLSVALPEPVSESGGVLLLAAWPGPRLEERWDELLVVDPRLLPQSPVAGSGKLRPLSPIPPSRLPASVLAAVSRFEDPAPFLAGLRRGGELHRVHANLGQLYASIGEGEQAERALRRALELADDVAETHLALAELLAAKGDSGAALHHYEEVLRLEPVNVRALGKAAELGLAEDPDLSLGRARRALKRAPHDADGHVTMGWVRLARGEGELAWQHFLRAIELAPGRADLLELLNREYPQERAVLADRVFTRAAAPLAVDSMRATLRPLVPLPQLWPVGEELEIDFELANVGRLAWPALGQRDGSLQLVVDPRWRRAESAGAAALIGEAAPVPLPRDLASGEKVRLSVRVRAPQEPGSYELTVDLRQRGVASLADRGSAPFSQPVEVR